jgi:hypothetical protein
MYIYHNVISILLYEYMCIIVMILRCTSRIKKIIYINKTYVETSWIQDPKCSWSKVVAKSPHSHTLTVANLHILRHGEIEPHIQDP